MKIHTLRFPLFWLRLSLCVLVLPSILAAAFSSGNDDDAASEPAFFVVSRGDHDIGYLSGHELGLAPIDGLTLDVPGLRQAVYANGRLAVLDESEVNGSWSVGVTLYDHALEPITARTVIDQPFKATSSPWSVMYYRKEGGRLSILHMLSDSGSHVNSTVPFLCTYDTSNPVAGMELSPSDDELVRLPWGIGYILGLNTEVESLFYTMGLNRESLFLISLTDDELTELPTDPTYQTDAIVGVSCVRVWTYFTMASGQVWRLSNVDGTVAGMPLPTEEGESVAVLRGSVAELADDEVRVVAELDRGNGASVLAGYHGTTLQHLWTTADMPSPAGWKLARSGDIVAWWASPGQLLLLRPGVAISLQCSAPIEEVIPVE